MRDGGLGARASVVGHHCRGCRRSSLFVSGARSDSWSCPRCSRLLGSSRRDVLQSCILSIRARASALSLAPDDCALASGEPVLGDRWLSARALLWLVRSSHSCSSSSSVCSAMATPSALPTTAPRALKPLRPPSPRSTGPLRLELRSVERCGVCRLAVGEQGLERLSTCAICRNKWVRLCERFDCADERRTAAGAASARARAAHFDRANAIRLAPASP